MNYITLPPIKNVDVDTLEKLKARIPVPVSLIVRTALARLAELPEDEYIDAVVKQAEIEKERRRRDADA